ncbi:nitric oxide reductase activation protein [Burkholderia cenocepacia]|uniref:Amidase accessory protein n=1 Tax=Burkholderia cenocepacia (strain ATCC BAA-245 / DSM 16553 / LMG 16656 / NCTC 13227 / J2315 / CF5610) TaxID=216591 RepID=B4EHV2_BURCJ|nr:nitric oxide reductase activation protein [Burkholderia cenocepacia]KIS51009.1 von Willebrand factor type A domain protein [Burkholderia cepacia]EPZ90351.1 von Willebrand factor type A domain protein [Burkholderia cenocepacia K56-2Valvano]ERI28399.1 von Willebrand factor type A domain protein [Burkholderia cenocepacia BC7]KKI81366.1 nitric oxide reductase activation protein [Burkholderia cenocepacia]KWF19932.1 nitric oxide reductase activation protein [Burkholderia cenocepacia]
MSALHLARFLHGMTAHETDVRLDDAALRATLGHAALRVPGTLPPAARIAAAAHALAHWLHSPAGEPADTLTPIGIAVAGLIEDARVEALLVRTWPGLATFWAPAFAPIDREGLTFGRLCARLAKALFDPSYRDGNPWVDKGAQWFAERRDRLDDYRAFRTIASRLANDLGQMRVRFEPDDGAWLPYRDDNAWLWAQPATAAEQAGHAGIEMSAATGGQSDEPDDEPRSAPDAPRYPEWNCHTQRERRDWTTIVERAPVTSAPPRSLAALIEADRRTAKRLPSPRASEPMRRVGRQLDGDALDVDAAIAARIARRARQAPDPRVFRRRVPHDARGPVLILLDLSASTAAQVAALEKRAAFVLGDLFDRQRRRWAVHGYTSDGRHRVYYARFKDFGDAFDTGRRAALLAADAGMSTRTGAALRHALALLRREAASARAAVLMIGDGEAADIDVFDPRYLVEDARHAVRQARQRGVAIAGLSFGAPPGLSTILGVGPGCVHAATGDALPAVVAHAAGRLSA